jgi:branched-chain amino acid transport system substrate-binding protein
MTKTLASHKVYAKGYIGLSSVGHAADYYGKALGKLADNTMSQGATVNYNHPQLSSIVADYKKKFGSAPVVSPSLYNYSAILLLADAIERAGSTNPKAIRDALAKSNFKGHLLCGDVISFDETGQNKDVVSPFNQFYKGENLVVWPRKFGVRDPVFPMPTWDEILK